MKIVLVSDLHLVAPGERLFGLDPLARLEDCIADINRNHADAELVVLSGDLTHDGTPAAYAALADRLGRLAPPHRMMIGNHDDRANFVSAFPDAPRDGGFVQSAADFGGWRTVFLDTHEPGRVDGRLCEARLGWLDAALADGRPALLFLHHPPFAIGIPSLDDCRLAEPERLLALIRRRGNVRHVFAGHVHRLAGGSWGGIPFTTVRGTSHQSALKFDGPYEVSFEPPSYAVVLAQGGDIVVHAHEFALRA